jgi:hypothetical protein
VAWAPGIAGGGPVAMLNVAPHIVKFIRRISHRLCHAFFACSRFRTAIPFPLNFISFALFLRAVPQGEKQAFALHCYKNTCEMKRQMPI